MQTITALTQDLRAYLHTSDHTESKAFIRSFVKEIAVAPGEATIRYAIPVPADNRTPDRGAAEEVLKSRYCLQYLTVAHAGFEPAISTLRGWCPRPLDECATLGIGATCAGQ